MRQALAALALTIALSIPLVNAIVPAQADQPIFWVTLCHRGHTIVVPRPAVIPHWRHGDTIGPCRNATPTPPRATATARPTSTATPRPTSTATRANTPTNTAVPPTATRTPTDTVEPTETPTETPIEEE
jgi:hypothetical protein